MAYGTSTWKTCNHQMQRYFGTASGLPRGLNLLLMVKNECALNTDWYIQRSMNFVLL